MTFPNEDAPDTSPENPTPLSDAEIDVVAGGVILSAGLLAGCPTCTSGGNPALARFASVINPDPITTLPGLSGAASVRSF